MEHWAYYYNEGIALKEAGDYERSAAHHVKALQLEPNLEMPEAWHNAGSALIRVGEKSEAVPYLEKAVQLYDLIIGSIHEAEELESEYDNALEDEDEEDDDNFELDGMDFFGGFGEDKEEDDPDSYRDEYDDNDYSEFEDDELYGDESVAYYLFWKACCLALLGDKHGMLDNLERSIAEDDWYAIEAEEEEELTAFANDPAFRQLIDPVLAKINAPNHTHLFEIFERMENKVLIGFEDPQEFIETLIEQVDDEKWVDATPETWMRKTTRDLHRKRLKESESWSHPTDLERLATAFNALSEDGIAALHNISSNDFDGVDDIIEELQGLASSVDALKGVCYYEESNAVKLIHEPGGPLYISFRMVSERGDEEAIELGKQIEKQLQAQGFDVRWRGTPTSPIEITAFWWKKVYIDDDNQEQWGPWRLYDKF